jgi:histidinol-phosphate phosphatase family protein
MVSKNKPDVVILAGGFGSRLKSRLGELPKPMVPLLGKPAIEYQIQLCGQFGFDSIFILVHYNNEIISDFFGDGSKWGVKIQYIIENVPRGTAGAVFDALPVLSDRFFVLYGDTYLDVDLQKFLEFHENLSSDFTIFVHPNNHPSDSDLVEVNSDSRVIDFHPYPHNESDYYPNLVNAALYIVNKNSISGLISNETKLDIAKDLFPLLLKSDFNFCAYISQEYIKDLGTPERLDKVTFDIQNGIAEKLSRRNKRIGIFLDRDGTIIEHVDHLSKLSEVFLIPNAANAIKKINQIGYLSVCITNQPVVARGEVSFRELCKIHSKMEFELGKTGAYLDGLFYCPHHPDSGYAGEISELKIVCDCRKPNIGMIEKAIEEMNIDRSRSWMIGDTTTDILTGINAGLKTILVKTGIAGKDQKFKVTPNYVFSDLEKAINWILEGENILKKRLSNQIEHIIKAKFVLIGGLARSGKSTAAELLKDIIVERGLTTHIISLDGWILPFENRIKGMNVSERYDFKSINSFLEEIINLKNTNTFQIPIYDRVSRRAVHSDLVKINPSDIVIIEGVPSLVNNELLSKVKYRMFISIEESIRKTRFFEDYIFRGFNLNEVEELYKLREMDEHAIVLESAKNANFIVNL